MSQRNARRRNRRPAGGRTGGRPSGHRRPAASHRRRGAGGVRPPSAGARFRRRAGAALRAAGRAARSRAGAVVAWANWGQRGFGTLEYALVIAVMAVGCLFVMTALRDRVREVFSNITTQLQPYSTGNGGPVGGPGGS